jgi:hypothetical protein
LAAAETLAADDAAIDPADRPAATERFVTYICCAATIAIRKHTAPTARRRRKPPIPRAMNGIFSSAPDGPPMTLAYGMIYDFTAQTDAKTPSRLFRHVGT